ncbi:hypothetical protein [Lentzea sp.]|uniref:hypothetical protein n=1 Tax=Lentzea sp. TaxID=56099 RepID=UPI0039C97A81
MRAHAATLAGYADRLSAAGGRLPDRVGQEALGSFARFLAAGLSGAMGETRQAFTEIASTMDKVGAGMRQTADTYQRTDDESVATITGAAR